MTRRIVDYVGVGASSTEDQARRKTCCANDPPSHLLKYCIGSRCMAWRWTGVEQSKAAAYAMPDGTVAFPGTVAESIRCEQAGGLRQGYCGLAGAP